MSQLTIKLSAKADALIAQLQKEIFNRRRKKIAAAGVVESLVESAAKSQSDKRFATSWLNLIKDIEKAAKLASAHGSKPSNLSNEEWALILSHRSRKSHVASTKHSAIRDSKAKKSGVAAKTQSIAKEKSTRTIKPSKSKASSKEAKSESSKIKVDKPKPARRARRPRTQEKANISKTTAISSSDQTSLAK